MCERSHVFGNEALARLLGAKGGCHYAKFKADGASAFPKTKERWTPQELGDELRAHGWGKRKYSSGVKWKPIGSDNPMHVPDRDRFGFDKHIT